MLRTAKYRIIIPQYWLPWEMTEGKSSSTADGTDPTENEDEISSELFDLASRGGGWHKVLRHCKAAPFDATYQDEEKYQTPLYVACKKRPPVRIVRALLEAFPDAAKVKSRHGDLPLHVACQHNASIGVLVELLKIYPGTAAFRTQWGKTPVNVLWEARESQENQENYSSIFWQKVQLLLEAVARHNRYSTRGVRSTKLFVVHAAVSLPDCPEGVLKFALHKFPEQAKMRDGHGQLPLHIAVKSPPPSWSLPSKQFLKRSGNRAETVLGRYSDGVNRPESAISRLLQLYPAAAKEVLPKEKERFPLHVAILHCHQWYGGVRELFEAAPEAMHVVDPIHGFYPFQMAAVKSESLLSSSSAAATGAPGATADTTDLDSIYHLLRGQPASLEDFIRTQRREAQARAAARQVIRAAARKMLAERRALREAEALRQQRVQDKLEALRLQELSLHREEAQKRQREQEELAAQEALRKQREQDELEALRLQELSQQRDEARRRQCEQQELARQCEENKRKQREQEELEALRFQELTRQRDEAERRRSEQEELAAQEALRQQRKRDELEALRLQELSLQRHEAQKRQREQEELAAKEALRQQELARQREDDQIKQREREELEAFRLQELTRQRDEAERRQCEQEELEALCQQELARQREVDQRKQCEQEELEALRLQETARECDEELEVLHKEEEGPTSQREPDEQTSQDAEVALRQQKLRRQREQKERMHHKKTERNRLEAEKMFRERELIRHFEEEERRQIKTKKRQADNAWDNHQRDANPKHSKRSEVDTSGPEGKPTQTREKRESKQSNAHNQSFATTSPRAKSAVFHWNRKSPKALKNLERTPFPDKILVTTKHAETEIVKASSIAKARTLAHRKGKSSEVENEKEHHRTDPAGKTGDDTLNDRVAKAKKREFRRRQAHRRERRQSVPFEVNLPFSPSCLPENIFVDDEPDEVSDLTTFQPWYAVDVGEQISI